MKAISPYISFLRYLVSGFSSVVIQFVVLAFFVEILALDESFSSGAAFIIACVVNYLMLYYWAFESQGKHLSAVLRYTLVTGFGLLLNLLIFWFLITKMQLWYLLAQSFATLAVSLLTYVINRAYTFAYQEEIRNGE